MHSDNGIFASDRLHLDCDNKQQDKYFSVVVAKHHKSRAERSIQNIMYMEITFMVYSSLN